MAPPLTSPVAKYLSQHIAQLSTYYDRTFNVTRAGDVLGTQLASAGAFALALELKEKLRAAYQQATTIDRKIQLARYFVTEWGGIKGLSQEALRAFVIQLDPLAGRPRPHQYHFEFNKVSSWSKWLSVLCPDWAPIYDARVAYSLNAINVISNADMKVFPAPEGRNQTLKLLDATTLSLVSRLQREASHTVDTIKAQHFVSRDDVYATYMDILMLAHRELWPAGTSLAHTEMLLFALADTVIFKDLLSTVSEGGRMQMGSASTN